MEWKVVREGLDHFAEEFWKYVDGKRLFAFHGEMGAGKTTIITALCRHKGVHDAVASPTFSIINEYIYDDDGPQKKVYHIDLYRLRDDEEVVQSGVEDCVYGTDICFVEWPEKAPWLFGSDAIHVYIDTVSETERIVRIKMKDELS
jgi:tRNA threonylcarbamoyladenosine biosynthesis protein TsaE